MKLLVAVGVMAAVVWYAAGVPHQWIAASTVVRVVWLSAVVVLGATVYFATLWLLGFRLRDFARFESR